MADEHWYAETNQQLDLFGDQRREWALHLIEVLTDPQVVARMERLDRVFKQAEARAKRRVAARTSPSLPMPRSTVNRRRGLDQTPERVGRV